MAADVFPSVADLGWEGNENLSIEETDLKTAVARTIDVKPTTPGFHNCVPVQGRPVSPDGKFALVICEPSSTDLVPRAWTRYLYKMAAVDLAIGERIRLGWAPMARQLFYVDLADGAARPLIDAPQASSASTLPIWLDKGHRVVIPMSLLPLRANPDTTDADRRSRLYAIESSLDASGFSVVGEMPASALTTLTAELRRNSTEIAISIKLSDGSVSARYFRLKDGRWKPIARSGSESALPRLFVKQGLNSRPILYVSKPDGSSRRPLLDPNPWLENRSIGPIQDISWACSDGLRWRGALYYPLNYRPGRKFPLLIQTHGYEPDVFSLNGISRNFPGEVAAARGMFVLQIHEEFASQELGSTAEWERVKDGYERAIDALATMGLVDEKRIGIIGWSRTGPHMAYTITHSDHEFAAGAFTDTATFDPLLYMSNFTPGSSDRTYGGPPTGYTLKKWLEMAPTFSLDRVRTPLLIFTSFTAWNDQDWTGGLRAERKPVERWVRPAGVHDVFGFQARVQMTEMLVDWFDFWLNGHEDPAAGKVAQYGRWRSLRDEQRAIMALPRPPLLQWTPVPK